MQRLILSAILSASKDFLCHPPYKVGCCLEVLGFFGTLTQRKKPSTSWSINYKLLNTKLDLYFTSSNELLLSDLRADLDSFLALYHVITYRVHIQALTDLAARASWSPDESR